MPRRHRIGSTPAHEVTQANVVQLAKDLLAIAKLAMPDTYYATDSRCQRARRVLQGQEALPKSEARYLKE